MTTGSAAPAVSERRSEAPTWYLLLGLTLACLGFFLPFSSAGVAVAEFVLLLLLLARPGLLARLAPWKDPVMAAGLVLLAYIVVHTLIVSGVPGLRAVNRYQELLAAPLLMALLHDARHRLVFIRAVMTGAVLLAAMYWAALLEPSLYGVLGSRRISAGFALAVCSFVLLVRADAQPRPWPGRALSAFMAVTVLFAIDGRTGHVVLLLLASCAAWVHSPRRWRWLAALAIPLLLVAVAMGSGAVNSRLKETLAGSQPANAGGEMSSTAIRIELLRLAGDLVVRHGVAGAGYANYSDVHEQAARERYHEGAPDQAHLKSGWVRASNPHNEYLMHLISGGVPALALFLAWLGLTFRHAARASRPTSAILAGMALAFALGCLFNSLLMDFVEGHLYVALLAWLLAESRDARPAERKFDRILVVATRQIGDVLLTTPMIHSARRRWPQARIEVLAFEGTAGMLRGNPDVNRLIESPARTGWRGFWTLFWQLRRRYDLALVTDPGDRAHLLGFLAAPLRSGIIPREGRSNWLKKSLLHHAVTSAGDLGDVHVTVEKQRLLGPWIEADGEPPQVAVPPAEALPPQVRQAIKPGAVVVHAPSMWPYKQWPMAHFRTLVSALLEQGTQVVLTGSASPRDQECVAVLRGLAPPPRLLDLSGQLNFNQLVTLLQDAALYIGPDTSVSHLAAATGVPVIAILGPTNPMRWAPWPAHAGAQEVFARSAGVQQVGNVTVVQSRQHCVPCGRAGCEDLRTSRSECLESITPEQVLDLARKVLEKVEAEAT
jgi:ADP-heptose:LPS heptosyltransferase/O-antigen ligase